MTADETVLALRERAAKMRAVEHEMYRKLCYEPGVGRTWLDKFLRGEVLYPRINKVEALDLALKRFGF